MIEMRKEKPQLDAVSSGRTRTDGIQEPRSSKCVTTASDFDFPQSEVCHGLDITIPL
jgi:hypothetical protein